MSGPDGQVEREQWAEERADCEDARVDAMASRAEEDLDETLLAVATSRMNDFFINKVIEGSGPAPSFRNEFDALVTP